MALNEQWNLKSRSHVCHATGRPFEEGEPFHTALYESGDGGGFERRDYSEEAWIEAQAADDPPAFSHWRTVYTPPPRAEKKEEAVRRESAEELLHRLVTEDEPHTEDARFILAVMLERQKVLRQTDINRIGETKLLIYEHRKTGEVLIVRDPEIPLAEVDRVQQEVTRLLEGAANTGDGESTEAGEEGSVSEPASAPEENGPAALPDGEEGVERSTGPQTEAEPA